jgi:hypothetical protein
MWKKQRNPSLPKEWSEDFWNDIFGITVTVLDCTP